MKIDFQVETILQPIPADLLILVILGGFAVLPIRFLVSRVTATARTTALARFRHRLLQEGKESSFFGLRFNFLVHRHISFCLSFITTTKLAVARFHAAFAGEEQETGRFPKEMFV
jgi:hypothetical protein